MPTELPHQIVERLAAAMERDSDEQVLARIESLPPLADESDSRWMTEEYWNAAGYPFLALVEVSSKRRLRRAVRPILERASYGDPSEVMRGIRHAFEAIYKPDWSALADEYLAVAGSERLGTRQCAIECLVVVDDPRAIPVFERSIRDDPPAIRYFAEVGIRRLLHPEQVAAEAAKARAERDRVRQERLDRQALADASITNLRCATCGKPMPGYRRTCKHCGAGRTA